MDYNNYGENFTQITRDRDNAKYTISWTYPMSCKLSTEDKTELTMLGNSPINIAYLFQLKPPQSLLIHYAGSRFGRKGLPSNVWAFNVDQTYGSRRLIATTLWHFAQPSWNMTVSNMYNYFLRIEVQGSIIDYTNYTTQSIFDRYDITAMSFEVDNSSYIPDPSYKCPNVTNLNAAPDGNTTFGMIRIGVPEAVFFQTFTNFTTYLCNLLNITPPQFQMLKLMPALNNTNQCMVFYRIVSNQQARSTFVGLLDQAAASNTFSIISHETSVNPECPGCVNGVCFFGQCYCNPKYMGPICNDTVTVITIIQKTTTDFLGGIFLVFLTMMVAGALFGYGAFTFFFKLDYKAQLRRGEHKTLEQQ